MIGVSTFIRQVKAIAAEGPRYRLGGFARDGTCDCIGLIIGALRRAGGAWPGTHGSNYTARSELQALAAIASESQCYVGMLLFKAYEPGNPRNTLPARYRSGTDLRDYYHVGVCTQVAPLRITHCTGTGKPSSIRVDTKLGQWRFGGALKRVDYERAAESLTSGATTAAPIEAAAPTSQSSAAVVTTPNQGPLKLRAKPSKTSGLWWNIPHGASVVVLQTDTGSPGWWRVQYGKRIGYCMNRFLAVG